MPDIRRTTLHVDEEGRLVLPVQALADLGFKPGDDITVGATPQGIVLERSLDHLARLYIEPTNACNLDCRTCMRNAWDEPLGVMSAATFEQAVTGLKSFSPIPQVFFGGYGEPLTHPNLLGMIKQVRDLGAQVELITNGILLTPSVCHSLIDLGVDTIWISLDGITPESYADIRLGAALPQVMQNLQTLHEMLEDPGAATRLGIAFVAMRRNIHDLPALLETAKKLGARRFSVSNVLAHTPEMREEVLYTHSLNNGEGLITPGRMQVDLPRLDVNDLTAAALEAVFSTPVQINLAGSDLGAGINRCPFIRKNSVSLRWDGALSPCLPLLHSHTSYLDDRERHSCAYAVGNINDRGLPDLWMDDGYRALRKRLSAFDFSPCVYCNSCANAGGNTSDCFSNILPGCGGCLWAQGLIQCP